MKKVLLLSIVCFSGFLVLRAQSEQDLSFGKIDSFSYDPSSLIYYAIHNDTANLYIRLKVQNPLVQRKILTYGLTVWIDRTNRRKEKLGIHFPKGREEGMGGGGFHQGAPAMAPKKEMEKKTDETKDQYFPGIDIIELIGFDPYRESEVMLLRDSKIKPVLRRDSLKTLYYYCRLPLEDIYKNGSVSDNRTISIGFVTGKMEMPKGGGYPGGGGDAAGGTIMHWAREQKANNNANDLEKRQKEMDELSRETRLWIKNITLK